MLLQIYRRSVGGCASERERRLGCAGWKKGVAPGSKGDGGGRDALCVHARARPLRRERGALAAAGVGAPAGGGRAALQPDAPLPALDEGGAGPLSRVQFFSRSVRGETLSYTLDKKPKPSRLKARASCEECRTHDEHVGSDRARTLKPYIR